MSAAVFPQKLTGFNFTKGWMHYFTDKGDKDPTIQRLSQKPLQSQGPAGNIISSLDISKGSMNGFKAIRSQHGGENAKKQNNSEACKLMRQQILSGDADYKMPSNESLAKAFQELAARW